MKKWYSFLKRPPAIERAKKDNTVCQTLAAKLGYYYLWHCIVGFTLIRGQYTDNYKHSRNIVVFGLHGLPSFTVIMHDMNFNEMRCKTESETKAVIPRNCKVNTVHFGLRYLPSCQKGFQRMSCQKCETIRYDKRPKSRQITLQIFTNMNFVGKNKQLRYTLIILTNK